MKRQGVRIYPRPGILFVAIQKSEARIALSADRAYASVSPYCALGSPQNNPCEYTIFAYHALPMVFHDGRALDWDPWTTFEAQIAELMAAKEAMLANIVEDAEAKGQFVTVIDNSVSPGQPKKKTLKSRRRTSR